MEMLPTAKLDTNRMQIPNPKRILYNTLFFKKYNNMLFFKKYNVNK